MPRSGPVAEPPAAAPRSRKGAATRARLLDAAKAVFEETGFLEARISDILGKEAALFVPSGTMGNQLGIRVHCQAGDEFLCESNCHVLYYEQGAYAQLFGIAAQPVDGDHGVLHVEQLVNRIRPLNNDHYTRTRLVCLENTHNRGAGRVQPYDTVVEICGWAADNGLARHLDGARLFNAVVATGI